MGGHHHHHHLEHDSPKKLYWAVGINVLLTIVQVIGGLMSGSLSLMADALHNFSDAGALMIAAIAAKISKIPANEKMTYGYRRAQVLGALINSTSLVIIGFYLLYEASMRYFDPSPIEGLMVVYVAMAALVVDLGTALLMMAGAKKNINFRAAFIHNLSDAAASVVVIVSGLLIHFYQMYIVDLIATVLISLFILYHAFFLIKQCILILMQSTPPDVNIDLIKGELASLSLVRNVRHIHVWQLDENYNFLEATLAIDSVDLTKMEEVKKHAKDLLKQRFAIGHATLEIEMNEKNS
jgi:cobalt-zinc-cadmium efflux system protein